MKYLAWETLDHTSDLELLIRGQSEEELYANAALALLAQIAEPEEVEEREERRLRIKAESLQERFLEWLRELLYLDLTQGFLVKRAKEVKLGIKEGRYVVEAALLGEALDSGRHRLLHEVKTVTYQDFLYGKEGNLWRARVVFDV